MCRMSMRARDHRKSIIDDLSRGDGAEHILEGQSTDFELFSKAEKSVSTVQVEASSIESRERGIAAASREWRSQGAPTTYELLHR